MRTPWLLILLLALLPLRASAESSLREGHSADAGVHSRKGFTLKLKSDQDLIPIPGGGKLNGSRAELKLSQLDPHSTQIQLESAEIKALNWSHLRALHFRFDGDQGSAVKGNLLGGSIPVALWGEDRSGGFGILHVGGDAGFRYQHPAAGASRRDLQGQIEAGCTLEIHQPLTDRLSIEAYGEILAHLNADTEGLKDVSAEASLGGSLVYDLSKDGPYRVSTRTNPKTGELEDRKIPNQGMRLKWKLVGVDWTQEWGNAFVVDEKNRSGQIISTGVRYEF